MSHPVMEEQIVEKFVDQGIYVQTKIQQNTLYNRYRAYTDSETKVLNRRMLLLVQGILIICIK